MKRGKEFNLELSNNFNVSVGTVDNKNPKSIYITISAWGKTVQEKVIDYNKVISHMKRNIKLNIINNNINNRFIEEQTIVDFDVRESGIKFDKRSYMNCEITLFQKYQPLLITDNNLLTDLSFIIETLIQDIFDTSLYFEYHKTKK
jgi:hypothetical protein